MLGLRDSDILDELWVKQVISMSRDSEEYLELEKAFLFNPFTSVKVLNDILDTANAPEVIEYVASHTNATREIGLRIVNDLSTDSKRKQFSYTIFIEKLACRKLISLDDIYLRYLKAISKDTDNPEAIFLEQYMLLMNYAESNAVQENPFYNKLPECLSKHSGLDFDFSAIPKTMLPTILNWRELL